MDCAKGTKDIVPFAKRLISVANATLICLNNDMIDTIALIYSPVLRGDKEQDAM